MVDSRIKLLTTDELVSGFENGRLREDYDNRLILVEPRESFNFVDGDKPTDLPAELISGTWFDADDRETYYGKDGFHPRCESFEFTKLWYEIVGNYMDYYEINEWSVEHGGLRWEYLGGAKDEKNLRRDLEAIWPLAYAKYVEVSEELLLRGKVEAYI